MLPRFNDYYAVAKVFHEQNEILKKNRLYWRCEWWYGSFSILRDIFSVLDGENKENVWKKLGIDGPVSKIIPENQLAEFRKWINYNRYMLTYFEELLPSEIVEKLKQLGFIKQNSYGTEETNEFQNLLARFVAQGVVDKLEKKYFRGGRPGIIAISLSLLMDFNMIRSPKELIQGIGCQLVKSINDVIKERIKNHSNRDEYLNNLKKGVQNLYAIIIDTTWYNWFPDIAGARMPDGYDNCYGVIYNTNISQEIKKVSDEGLFNSKIPYQYQVSLEVDLIQ